MPIVQEYEGDICKSQMQTLICTVNTEGAMGKGVAKDMRIAFPGLYERYREACADGEMYIGSLLLFRYDHKKQIVCLPTKEMWRYPSKREWVEIGLKCLVSCVEHYNITSLALPPLGCGNGGLNWMRDIRPMVFQYLDKLPIEIEIVSLPK